MGNINLTGQQRLAIEMVKTHRVSVLTGGPGTGKTTTTLEIIRWAKSQNLKVAQAAPTGKAAKRMIEATGMYASTIHTLLVCEFDGKSFTFAHNERKALPVDLLILDELSMITVDLMSSVLKAVSNRTRVLLIGDQDQLPSVGPGAVLRDILASDLVPHTELDMIHRNTGEIVSVCHQIKQGKLYTPHAKLDLTAKNPINMVHIDCFTPEDTLLGIQKLVSEVIPNKYHFDPIEDIQVISPVNTKGPLSCESINNNLRKVLNPAAGALLSNAGEPDPEKYREGDKVINTKNSKAIDTDGGETAIVNGDIGIVIEVQTKTITILFADPDREVVILKKDQHLLHAYCITCHRFQGSEAPVIIIPVCTQFNYFLSNSWLYTAVSRAKTICITIGNFSTIERAIRNRIPNNRLTRLNERMVEAGERMFEIEFAGI